MNKNGKSPEENSKTGYGVLPSQELKKCRDSIIITPDTPKKNLAYQPSSIDLTLGPVAYRIQASFLPQDSLVMDGINDLSMYEIDLRDGATLERGAVYIIPLVEEVNLPEDYLGKTNPKSSTGRLDIFTRVITDKCKRFEEIQPGYKGKLYLEVVPRSFIVKVYAGQKLNQLRLLKLSYRDLEQGSQKSWIGHGSEWGHHFEEGERIKDIYHKYNLLTDSDGEPISFKDFSKKYCAKDGLLMSVNLSPENDELPIVGYKSKKNSQVLDLEKVGQYEVEDFWEQIHAPKNGKLILEPEEFYIFASKEKIRIPLDYAAEMVEFDAGSGELRTHYAGFFDPGFGYGKAGEINGTKAVLEVRPHDVPFIIEDGQILFKMKYEKMMEKPDIYYGAELGSNYHDQSLKLSKLFRQ